MAVNQQISYMNIDNKLQFDKLESSVCKNVNNQLNVMLRFRKLVSKDNLVNCIRTYHTFIIIWEIF